MIPYGYNGRIARIDLSNDKISIEEPEYEFYRKFIGGWGFIGYYLLKELKPKIDPLGPKNKLIFALGVVTGTPVPGSGRNSVGAKSPLTGAFGATEVGGFWGAELKHAGFDALVIEGKAEKPIYLWINDGEIQIRDASHLWGRDIGESQLMIRKELKDNRIRTAQIGVGGENLVRFACVVNGLKHTAGRTGMGAVMGSKKLKAIAVRGGDGPEVADPDKLRALAEYITRKVKGNEFTRMGTGRDMEYFASVGNLPTHNFRDANFPFAKDISAYRMAETIITRMESCYFCSVHCKKIINVSHVDPQFGGPEYETLAALGSNCGIGNLEAICKANELCQKYTLDTISTGVTIAFAMECFEKGLLTDSDTGGIKLVFGDASSLIAMVEMIAKRQDFGDLLAEGCMRAAKKIGKGAEKFAIHVKGQEVPLHEPRLKESLGLGYAVSPTGADHCHNLHSTVEKVAYGIFDDVRTIGPSESFVGKRAQTRLFVYLTNWSYLNNCLLLCNFVPWGHHHKMQIVRATTGWNSTLFELYRVGERAVNLAKAFNVREGFSEKDDWLPNRFFEPQRSGFLSNTSVNPQELQASKHIYYEMMGWNRETGKPTREKLEELGLTWVADELSSSGFRL